MSATDPLREALIGSDPLDPRWTWLSGAAERLREHAPADEDSDAMYACADVLTTLYAAIRKALAAVPAEPERNDKRARFLAGHGTLDALEVWAWAAELGEEVSESAIESDEPLMVSVVPAESEVWEWRAVVKRYLGETASTPVTTIDAARATLRSLSDAWDAPGWIERRRPGSRHDGTGPGTAPGTAPGEWERVDPEPPREACGHRAPLNYDRTRYAACTRDVGHGGEHRQGDLAWTDRTMPCRVDPEKPRPRDGGEQ